MYGTINLDFKLNKEFLFLLPFKNKYGFEL